ncbi:Protein of unknown function [Lactobacillus delbrueckii subsp. lactis]|nr:Protein of unknown function [Lactobacillus delbrueckii subsp. lactis]CDR82535.1 Protein of unknown function [Lactobacillus delbrueckii subsp. lactis]
MQRSGQNCSQRRQRDEAENTRDPKKMSSYFW